MNEFLYHGLIQVFYNLAKYLSFSLLILFSVELLHISFHKSKAI